VEHALNMHLIDNVKATKMLQPSQILEWKTTEQSTEAPYLMNYLHREVEETMRMIESFALTFL
jgi:hypothetical protein